MTDADITAFIEKMKAMPRVFGIAYKDGFFLMAVEGAYDAPQEATLDGHKVHLISYSRFLTLADEYRLWEAGPAVPKRRSPEEELQQFLPPGAKIVSVVGDDVTFTLKLAKPLSSVDLHIPNVSKESDSRD